MQLQALSVPNLFGDGCRQRIADQVFDDPPRVLPPQPEKQKVELELQDKKSHKVSTAQHLLLHVLLINKPDGSYFCKVDYQRCSALKQKCADVHTGL